MDDLVERLLKHATLITDPILYAEDRDVADSMREAAARIQALETSLAEAEGRVIAEVVAWLRHPNTTMKHMDLWIVRTKAGNIKSQSLKDIGVAGWFAREAATALETGEWKK